MTFIIVLVGPTAVGKSALALQLAPWLNAEIVACDSRTIYMGMDIGTAKPTQAERTQVPHHLIDVTTPDKPWTLSTLQQAAYAIIADIQQRGKVPLLVGGTGQYVRCVIEGWEIPPGPLTTDLRTQLETDLTRHGLAALVQRLQTVDAASAARIDVRNPRRVVRALEVALTTGASFVQQRKKSPPPFTAHLIGLTMPRPALYARIDARIDAMLAAGLVEEVHRLAAHYAWELPAMSAVGYREIGEYLRGECDLPEAVRRIKHNTRTFVRRQGNWFRQTDPTIQWFETENALESVKRYLSTAKWFTLEHSSPKA